jgi:hypothetical protein
MNPLRRYPVHSGLVCLLIVVALALFTGYRMNGRAFAPGSLAWATAGGEQAVPVEVIAAETDNGAAVYRVRFIDNGREAVILPHLLRAVK